MEARLYDRLLAEATQITTPKSEFVGDDKVYDGKDVLIIYYRGSDIIAGEKYVVRTFNPEPENIFNNGHEHITDYIYRSFRISIYNRQLQEFLQAFQEVNAGDIKYELGNNETTWRYFVDRVLRLNGMLNGDFYFSDMTSIHFFIQDFNVPIMFDHIDTRTDLQILFNEEPNRDISEEYFRNIRQQELFEPYTEQQMIDMLRDIKLMEFIPDELPFVNFDKNEAGLFEKHNCVVRALLATQTNHYTYAKKNGKMLSPNTVIKYFGNTESTKFSELLAFCDKMKIRITVCNVFGSTIVKRDHGLKKTSRNDLNLLYFNGHIYPYTKQKKFKSNFDMSIENYNDNYKRVCAGMNIQSEDSIILKIIKDVSMPFTNNFNYVSEKDICVRSIRGSVVDKIDKDYYITLFGEKMDINTNLHRFYTIENNEAKFVNCNGSKDEFRIKWNFRSTPKLKEYDYIIAEIDLNKAFENITMRIMPKEDEIPIFSVESIIRKFVNSDLMCCQYSDAVTVDEKNIYIMKKEWLDKPEIKEYFIYNNVHMGKTVNYLLSKGKMVPSDIDYVKHYTSTLPLEEFRSIYGKILVDNSEVMSDEYVHELRKKLNGKMNNDEAEVARLREYISNLDFLRKSYCLFNGMFGRKYTSINAVEVSSKKWSNYERDLEVIKSKSKNIIEDYDIENNRQCIRKTTRSRYLYNNNRNIYDYCVSSCNYYMMKALDDFKECNPEAVIARVCTDCISFIIKNEKEGENKEINVRDYVVKDFKIKECDMWKIAYTGQGSSYVDPEIILDNLDRELDVLAENVQSITGGPGTGKTHKVKSEAKYQYAMTISNACCRNMDTEDIRADTIYSQLRLNEKPRDVSINDRLNKFNGKTVWFDEFSMFDHSIFNYIFMTVMLKDSKIIISGDINQIGPFNSGGIDMSNLFYRKLFKNVEKLTHNYRVQKIDDKGIPFVDEDCKKLLDLSNGILDNLEDDAKLIELVKEARGGNVINELKDNIHLVFTRKCRNRINNYIYDTRDHKFSIIHQTQDYTINAKSKKKEILYDVQMTNGLRLQVDASCKKSQIYKSVIYEVQGDIRTIMTREDTVKLRNITRGIDEDINIEMLSKMVLGFAVTTHSSQGLTINEPCTIHQVHKMIESDPRILYTAVTRLTKFSDLKLRVTDYNYDDETFRKNDYFFKKGEVDILNYM